MQESFSVFQPNDIDIDCLATGHILENFSESLRCLRNSQISLQKYALPSYVTTIQTKGGLVPKLDRRNRILANKYTVLTKFWKSFLWQHEITFWKEKNLSFAKFNVSERLVALRNLNLVFANLNMPTEKVLTCVRIEAIVHFHVASICKCLRFAAEAIWKTTNCWTFIWTRNCRTVWCRCWCSQAFTFVEVLVC